MKNMVEKLGSLIEVRKLVTLAVVVLFIILALRDQLDPNFIENVVLIVIGYYFAKSTALDPPKK